MYYLYSEPAQTKQRHFMKCEQREKIEEYLFPNAVCQTELLFELSHECYFKIFNLYHQLADKSWYANNS